MSLASIWIYPVRISLIFGVVLALLTYSYAGAAEKTPNKGHTLVPPGIRIVPISGPDSENCGWWCRNKWGIIGGVVAALGGGAVYLLNSDEKKSESNGEGSNNGGNTGSVVYEW